MNQEEFSKKPIEEKLNAIFKSVEKTRRYFLWTLILGVITFLLPLVILMVVLPKVVGMYSGLGL